MALKLAINGVLGRMGRAIARLAADAGHTVTAAIDVTQHGQPLAALLGDARQKAVVMPVYPGGADVLIDFSSPAGFAARVHECMNLRTALVSGTTGLEAAQQQLIPVAAQKIPFLWAPNFSLGVNLLLSLVRQAAKALPEGYDIEIIETHHRRKEDAPSGTAIALLQAACTGRGLDPKTAVRHGREGRPGARTPREVGMHAVRGGDVVGDHTVLLAAEGERVELTHKASTRDTFAAGSIKAAEWLAGKPAGAYGMAQVLGLQG
ncbi:MAG: 4-hydroxy-tetrahydrodipicolinate reductase [Planctomycetes bacterium]|nr:4-hydroxy-tetrahydrodipicolinate reductase [Planctomycetota bacterium]